MTQNQDTDLDFSEERGGDRRLPLTLWQTVYTSAVKFGPWMVLAAFLVWFLTLGIKDALADIKSTAIATQKELHDHARDQRFYLGSLCYMAARQAGEPTDRCTPPSQ